MSPYIFELLKKALALPPEARAALAGSLLESLDDEPAEEGVEAAWEAEIKRRIEDIDSGKVQMIPYEEVRRRLAALLSNAGKQALPLLPASVARSRRGRGVVSATQP